MKDQDRPRSRAECRDGARPCPFVSCRYHLHLDVNPAGSLKLNHPGLEPWQLLETCALDVADRGGTTLQEVGDVLGVTKEGARTIQLKAIRKMRCRTLDKVRIDAY